MGDKRIRIYNLVGVQDKLSDNCDINQDVFSSSHRRDSKNRKGVRKWGSYSS